MLPCHKKVQSMKVRKAVIAAAGLGTRFLPQTKAMPKEMLPIIDKPVIQLVVEGLVEAGVEDIIIVTGPTKRAIEDHFDRSLELESELLQKDNTDMADQLRDIAKMANFIYIRQKGHPKGNARPILNAAHMIGDEPFFFFFADDFFTGNVSTATQLLRAYEKTGKSVVALREVPENEISQYGIADVIGQPEGRLVKVKGITEKPTIADAPSKLAVGSGYLLTPDIIPILEEEKVGPDGEVRINDAFQELAEQDPLYGVIIDGEYHDTGNPGAYLRTLIDITLEDPQYGDMLRDYIRGKM
jgi:UTP--glucose-1-phosphate uridylyltransferase